MTLDFADRWLAVQNPTVVAYLVAVMTLSDRLGFGGMLLDAFWPTLVAFLAFESFEMELVQIMLAQVANITQCLRPIIPRRVMLACSCCGCFRASGTAMALGETLF